MAITVTVRKENAMGETLTFETTLAKGVDDLQVYETLLPLFRALDRRQFELNLRILEVNKQIGKLDPEAYALMRNILAGFNNILLEQPETVPAEDNGGGHAS